MNLPRVILITANKFRHKYVANQIGRGLSLVGIVSESKARTLLDEPIPASFDPDARLMHEHLAEMAQIEQEYFGTFREFPNTDVLEIERGTVNSEAVHTWIRKHVPDMLLLYGCGLIKTPLLATYENRIINMHLGLSPYYRGAATNFWPLVNREPEGVGATIHLAVAHVDAGAILSQARPTPSLRDTAHEFGCKSIIVGTSCFINSTRDYFAERIYPKPQKEGGRIYRARDFNAAAVRQLRAHFETGMMGEFISDYSARVTRFPIIMG